MSGPFLAPRLHRFRRVYARGFVHGFLACAVGVAFFAYYLWVGSAS